MRRAIFLLLAGCGPSVSEACLGYTTAITACFEEAEAAGIDVDSDNSDPEGFCQSFEDVEDATWTCETAAITGGDCSTAEGMVALEAEREACS